MMIERFHIAIALVLITIALPFSSANAQLWEWSTNCGATATIQPMGVASDGNGNSFVVGGFTGMADFGNGVSVMATGASRDIFVARFNAYGVAQWAIAAGTTGDDCALDIALDLGGNIYLTGHYTDSLRFAGASGSINVIGHNYQELFVAKLNTINGQAAWVATTDGMVNAQGNDINVLGNAIYITGSFEGNCNFGSTPLSSLGQEDIAVAQIDALSGAWGWAISGGTPLTDVGQGICNDGNALYITGSFGNATFNLGSTSLAASGMQTAFASKLDANGLAIWSQAIGSPSVNVGGMAIATGGGQIFVTGNVNGAATVNFGSGPTFIVSTPATLGNFWCTALDTGNFGAPIWAMVDGGAGQDSAFGIVIADLVSIAIVGSYSQTIMLGSSTLNAANSAPFIYYVSRSMGGGIRAVDGVTAGNATARDVCSDAGCGVFCAGDHDQSLTFAGLSPIGSNLGDGFVGHYLQTGGAAAPVVNPVNDTICLGDSTNLSLLGIYDLVSWTQSIDSGLTWTSVGGINPPFITVHPIVNTIYLATSQLACQIFLDTAWVTVRPLPQPFILGFRDSACISDPPFFFDCLPNAPAGSISFTSAGYLDLGNGQAQFDPAMAGAGGPFSFSYQYTDSFGCKSSVSDSVFVAVGIPVVIAGLDSSYCSGDTNVSLTGSLAPNGQFASPFACLTNLGPGVATFSPQASPLNTLITVSYSFYNGCVNRVNAVTTVYPNPVPIFSSLDSFYCIGGGADTVFVNGLNGGLFTTRPWVMPISDTSAIILPSGLPPQDTTLSIVYNEIDGFGCAGQVMQAIPFYAPPIAQAGNDTSLCEGASDSLGNLGLAFWNYTWSSIPLGLSSILPRPLVQPFVDTRYILMVTDQHACIDRDSLDITVIPAYTADAGIDRTLCQGDSAVLGGNLPAGVRYLWVGSQGFTSTLTHPVDFPQQSQNYFLAISDSAGFCYSYDTLRLNVVVPVGNVNAGIDQVISETSTNLDAQSLSSGIGTWVNAENRLFIADPNAPNSLLTGMSPGTWLMYWVVANAPCPELRDSMLILVVEPFYPTGFSPNGDGKNDALEFKGLELSAFNRLQVYNRWGSLVYQMENYDNKWEGTHNGKPLVDDTYYYILELEGQQAINNFLVLKRE